MTAYLARADVVTPIHRFDPATAEPVEVLLAMLGRATAHKPETRHSGEVVWCIHCN